MQAGRTPGDEGWGHDSVMGSFTPVLGETVGAPEAVSTLPGNYLAFYEDLARCLSGAAPNPVSGPDALKVMRLLEQGVISATQGRRVTL